MLGCLGLVIIGVGTCLVVSCHVKFKLQIMLSLILLSNACISGISSGTFFGLWIYRTSVLSLQFYINSYVQLKLSTSSPIHTAHTVLMQALLNSATKNLLGTS